MSANRPPQTTHKVLPDGSLRVTWTGMADVEETTIEPAYNWPSDLLKDEKIAFLRSRIIGLYRALKEAQNG